MAIPPAILLTMISGVDLESVGYLNPAAESTNWALLASTYQHKITSQVEKLHTARLHELIEADILGSRADAGPGLGLYQAELYVLLLPNFQTK